MFTAVNNNKYKKICSLDMIDVKKQHNKELGHIIEIWDAAHGHGRFTALI